MECLNKDCKITSLKERLLTCWLCEKHEHLKCLGFNGKHFDIITDRKYGLRWSCDNCRSLEVDFYRRKAIWRHRRCVHPCQSFQVKFQVLMNSQRLKLHLLNPYP